MSGLSEGLAGEVGRRSLGKYKEVDGDIWLRMTIGRIRDAKHFSMRGRWM